MKRASLYTFEVVDLTTRKVVDVSTAVLFPNEVITRVKALQDTFGPTHKVLVDFRDLLPGGLKR